MLSFKKTLFICLCLVTVVTANPIHTIGRLDALPAGSCPFPQVSTSPLTTSQSNGKHCNPSDRSCRLHCRPPNFHIWSARLLELAFPIHLVAPVLSKVFNAILTQANEHWSIHSPISGVWTKQSNLELSSASVHGLVPWSVATDSARRVLSATQTGWTGSSDIMYQTGGANFQNADNQRSLTPRHLAKPSTISIAETRDLKKRVIFPATSFTVHAAILPVSVAAPYIKDFFDGIAVRASSEWTFYAERSLFTITSGPFHLTVSCLGANVPWPALEAAARHFSSLADRSWTNTFDAFYTEPESAITIAFSLRLVQQARGRPAGSITGPHARRTKPHLESQKSPPIPTPTTTHLNHPRTPTLISAPGPGLKLTRFVRTAALVPSAVAATHFEDFYNIIAMKIETGQWANRLPSKYIRCMLWDFELTFRCDTMNVPFSFVQAFAIDMAEWSSRQFTGFYEATVTGEGPLAGLVFVVKMGLKSKGGLADGNGAE
ncbi:hypothetical protein BDR22DRAFT_816587 [Usnea florida]